MSTTRRSLLAGLAASPLLGLAAWAGDVLRAGDQKGGTQSVMKAAGVLDGLPYRLEWSQFSAAAPLLEALNADAVDLAFAGDAPTTFAMAAGVRARIIASVRTSGAGTAVMVPPGTARVRRRLLPHPPRPGGIETAPKIANHRRPHGRRADLPCTSEE
jgi:sulfonate transport system substrate-binding protein